MINKPEQTKVTEIFTDVIMVLVCASSLLWFLIPGLAVIGFISLSFFYFMWVIRVFRHKVNKNIFNFFYKEIRQDGSPKLTLTSSPFLFLGLFIAIIYYGQSSLWSLLHVVAYGVAASIIEHKHRKYLGKQIMENEAEKYDNF